MTGERDENATTGRHINIETIEPLSLDESLSIVGEHTRATIIIELGGARTTDPTVPNALTFSELMERADIEDSGRFNYHLDKLVGPFVKKDSDGYSLRLPGQLIYEALVAGTLTDRKAIEPFQVGTCPECDAQLSAAYHPDHLLTVECPGCETLFDAAHLPARGIEDRENDELLEAAYQRRHHKLATMRRGVCHICGAVVNRALEPTTSITYGSASVEEMAGLDVYAVLECTGCRASLVGHPTNIAVTTPTVIGFFADHDLDVALSRWWKNPIAAARDSIEIIEEDPISVRIPFEIDGDHLSVVIDNELQVVHSKRTEERTSEPES